jgi:branched-chain amino acid transport system permease protein
MRRAKRPGAVGALVAFAIALGVALGFWLSDYYLFLATSAVTAAIIARSIGLVTGEAGMITLCQMGFAAVGAYVTTGLTTSTGLPFFAQVALATLAGIPFGLAVGLPALRIRGINLAVITLGFAVALDIFVSRQNFPGVEAGVGVLPPAPLDTVRGYYLFCLACFVAVCAALAVLSRGRTGAAWLAVRHSERAAATLGLSVTRTKLQAFALSAMVAALGGALMAGQVQLPTPDAFNPLTSLVAFAAAVMFAARYPEGAVLAGGVGVALQEAFRRLGIPLDYVDLLFGVGVVDVLRRGRGGVAQQLRSALAARRRRARAGDRAHAAAAPPARTAAAVARGSAPPALRTDGLTVRYGAVVAVESLDLVVPAAAVVALIGPNGAGKSSAIDAIAAFVAYEGTVHLAGETIDHHSVHARARAGLRRAFQQDRTIPDLTVGRYLELAARGPVTKRELAEVLAFVGGVAPGNLIAELDVGTRRLVEVAGVLVARPVVAMLDEPAAGLAPAESRQLAQRVTEVPERFGAAVLLVEHDMEHVQAAASTAVVMDFGRVIARGPTAAVLRNEAVIAAYLGNEVSAA